MTLRKWFVSIAMSLTTTCLSLICSASDTVSKPVAIPARLPLAVGVAFDQHGRLWLAKVENERLLVSWSADLGKQFSPAVVVTPKVENIGADGENRPKIAVTSDGTVLLTWTQLLSEPRTGNIRFSRSIDGGKTFSPPVTLNDDRRIASHRFETLLTDGNGKVTVAWLDARERDAAREKNKSFKGVSLYTIRSNDNGARFNTNQRLQSHTCECCRIGGAWSHKGPVIFWRHLFNENTRDFALQYLNDGEMLRVTDDEWQIDGCPHHGGDLTAARVQDQEVLHIVWFTNGRKRQGSFYRRFDGKNLSKPMPLGNHNALPGHPSVAAWGHQVLVTWREFDGKHSSAWMMHSSDGGINWQPAVQLAKTSKEADYPIPVFQHDGHAWVIWHTAAEGLRVLAVNEYPQH